jgi:Transcriptional regulator, AbiEi antitoxin
MLESLRPICLAEGVFLRSEAIALGLDDATLRRALRSRDLIRVRHGAYTFRDLWAAADERERHLVLAHAVRRSSPGRVALSHHSAALLHGMDVWDVPLSRVHVTRLDDGAGRVLGDAVHHEGVWSPEELTPRDGLVATRPVRAALESALLLDVEHGLCVVDSALRSGLFTKDELSMQVQAMTCWPRSQHLQLLGRLADGRSESVGETRSRHLFWRAGIPAPILQYEVHDRGRLVGITDFAWPEHGLLGEFDGRVKYGKHLRPGEDPSDAVFREKQREDLLRRLTGWRMVRLTWTMLGTPQETAQMVRSMMRAAA